MPAPQHVYFAFSAYQRIVQEARNSPNRETGGILVGRMFTLESGKVLVVVATSGPGASADRQAHTYAPDIQARQNELNEYRHAYAEFHVDYVGEWHKHPPGLRQPSDGDTRQVVGILSAPSYHLPDGIFTPLVTIEGGEFLLHGHYYPRETMLPEQVHCKYIRAEDDVRDLLITLDEYEFQAANNQAANDQAANTKTGSKGESRWGVSDTTFESVRSTLGQFVPDAEVIDQPHFGPNTIIIDSHGYVPPLETLVSFQPGGTYESAQEESSSSATIPPFPSLHDMPPLPPFPSAPHPDEVPPGPPLPGRLARELSDLQQYCATRHAHISAEKHPDGKTWYRVTFTEACVVDSHCLPSSTQRQTPEGIVEILPIEATESVTIEYITIDPGDRFPEQPPYVNVVLNNQQEITIDVAKLFPKGWQRHVRIRDVLKQSLDLLSQPKMQQDVDDVHLLLEYRGRIIMKTTKETLRSVADVLAEINLGILLEQSLPPTKQSSRTSQPSSTSHRTKQDTPDQTGIQHHTKEEQG